MEEDRFKALYHKYLSNRCSPAELEEFQELLNKLSDPQNLMDVEDFPYQNDAPNQLSQEESDAILAQVLRSKQNKRHISWQRIIQVAAVFALVAFAVLWYLQSPDQPIHVVYANSSNGVKTLTLSDGTRILMRPQSQIIQLTDFNHAAKRKVQLIGEAFFEVAKRKDQPFLVQAENQVRIEVLGTRFNLNSSKQKQEVVLTEGSIAMSRGKETLKLRPAERAFFLESNQSLVKNTVDTLQYISWTMQQLYFNQARLKEVIQVINDNYPDQQLQIPKKFEELKFTGYLPDHDINQCIDILKTSYQNYHLVISIK